MKKYLATAILLLTVVISSKAQVELISGGTGAAYTLGVPGVFSLRNGIQVTFKAHDNSAVGATIDVNVTGAISIMKDGGTNALSASDIKAGQIVTLVFDGSNWQMMNPVATPPAAPTTYWSPNGSDIYNNNGGNVTVNADNSDGAYKMAIGKNASSVEKVLALTNTNNFVGGGTTFGFRSNFGGTLWDQASISGITGALSASGDLAFSVMQNRGTSTMIEAMRIKGNTGRIGIMTPNPDRTLHVLGDGLKIENAGTNLEIYPNGNEFMISTTKQYLSFAGNGGATAMYMDDGNITVNLPLTIQDGSQASGRVLASDASGNASWTDLSALSSGSTAWTRSTPNIYPTTLTDNVGIGLSNPISKVQIHSISGAGNFRLTSAGTGLSATDGFSMSNDGSTEMFMTQHENANWYFTTNGGTPAMTIIPSGKIGVGMLSPSAQLEIQNSTASATEKVGTFSLVNATGAGANVGLRGYATNATSSNYGVNAAAYGNSGTKYAVYGSATGTGTNYGGFFSATGGTTDYAILVPSGGGNVSIGSTNHNYSSTSAQVVSITDPTSYPVLEMNGYGVGTSSPATYVDHYKNDGTTNNHIVRLAAGTYGAHNTGFYDISVANAGTMSRVLTMNEGKVGIGTNSYANLNDIFNVYENDGAVDGENGANINVQNASGAYASATTGEMAGIRFKVGSYVPNGMNKAGIFYQRNATYGRGDLIFAINNSANLDNVNLTDEVFRISNTTNTNAIASSKATTASVGSFVNETTAGGRGITASASLNNATSASPRYGVYATAWYGTSTNYGVYGYGYGGTTAYGIFGQALGATTNWAGYFQGNVNVTGTLSKGGGTFKIDHPLDPQNKYLYHSFVESPDMMNIYNGNVTTNSSGIAEVTLPAYFEALNMEFRYQLTVIGDFAQAIILEKVSGNKFKIKTDKPSIEVSWQVTGVRKDPFANKNRVVPEVEKEAEHKGKYIHPEAYGQPIERGIGYVESESIPKEK